MITTDDDALADRLRVLRNQGMRQRYQYEMAGHNYRLTDLQAAVGIPQLAEYDAMVEAAQGERGPALRRPGRRAGPDRADRTARAARTCGTSTPC